MTNLCRGFALTAMLCCLIPEAVSAAPPSASGSGSGQFSLFGDASLWTIFRLPLGVQLTSDAQAEEPYAGISFEPKMRGNQTFTLDDLKTLSAILWVTEGGVGGGSPRFSIGLDEDDDGEADANVFVYIGDAPNFTQDTGLIFTGNLLTKTDLRVDTSQIGGTFYDTYANAIELAGDAEVVSVDLVVDSGWSFDEGVQSVLVFNVQVNNTKLNLRKLTAPQ